LTAPAPNAFRAGAVPGALLLITAFPLLLLGSVQAHFAIDWTNMWWMSGYIGEFLKLYHHFPRVFQTTQYLGMAYPTLYGEQVFRIAGALSAITGPDLALRIVVFAAAFFAVVLVYRATRILGGSRPLGLLAALTISCSTYSLTDLYNRGDLPEYIAIELVTGALAALFASLTVDDLRERWIYRLTIAGAWILVFGTHLISEAFGAIFFAAIVSIVLVRDHRKSVLVTVGCTVAGMVVGALWQVFAFVQLHGLMALPRTLTFYSDSIDSVLERFAPIPFDIRMLLPTAPVSSPYLEAPLDYGLLAIVVAAMFFARSRTALATLAVGAVFLVFSVNAQVWRLVPSVLQFVQFGYRLVAYADISVLAAFFAMVWIAPRAMARVGRTPVPWAVATGVILLCAIKLTQGAAVERPGPPPQGIVTYESLPSTFYGPAAYIVDVSKAPASPTLETPPLVPMQTVGTPATQSMVADKSGFVDTRILAFPWNVIVVDGKPIPSDRRLVWFGQPTYGIRLRPGSRHDISTYFAVPQAVEAGIRLAEVSLALDFAGIAVLIAWLGFRPERQVQAGVVAGTAIPS